MADKDKILLEVVTPEKVLAQVKADIVVAPGYEGEFGVLPGHLPFLTSLQTGEMYYKDGGETHYLAINGGYAEVLPDKVTVLAEEAESARDIDVDRAKRARERAEERIKKAKSEGLDYIQAEAELRRAMVWLKVAERRLSVQ